MNSSPVAAAQVVLIPVMTESDAARVRDLAQAAIEVDGVRPLGEHVMLSLRYGGTAAVRHVAAIGADGNWRGYGHLDLSDRIQGASAEVVVDPAYRRHGVGRQLVERMLQEARPLPLRLWAHGHHPASAALATRLGFNRARDLWQMRRSLHAALPEVSTPDGVDIRTFRVGADEDDWVAVNGRAFAGHPEQGAMTREDLEQRMREPWFDPAGFFVAERTAAADTGQARQMLGFHWTKVHAGAGHDPIGEVYVVGVDPDAQRLGLGKLLTVVGLRHLRDRGLDQVMLYVESDNKAAIAVYERLGFAHWDTDVMYCR